jgi:hypothetical protein
VIAGKILYGPTSSFGAQDEVATDEHIKLAHYYNEIVVHETEFVDRSSTCRRLLCVSVKRVMRHRGSERGWRIYWSLGNMRNREIFSHWWLLSRFPPSFRRSAPPCSLERWTAIYTFRALSMRKVTGTASLTWVMYDVNGSRKCQNRFSIDNKTNFPWYTIS